METAFSPDNLRLLVFAGLLMVFMGLEAIFPRKTRSQPRAARWRTNFAIILIDSLIVRLMGPLIAVSAAIFAASQGWGLFNILNAPVWLESLGVLIVLDFAIYVQHVVFHRVPLFWRFHKMHHADRDIDVTTALRFHPLEIVVSMLYKGLVIFVLGPSVLVVIIFEIILNAMAMFNHANLRLPLGLDKALRDLIVTPDMHRVHHSVLQCETHSNFGFNLSIWDRIFRTYKAEPKNGHDGMTIGLSEYQSGLPSKLLWSLKLPFNR